MVKEDPMIDSGFYPGKVMYYTNRPNVPVVILCGGSGTRLREETEFKPKPMISIGGKPMLWHIMKLYSFYGFRRFILALGYKQEIIKEYFLHYDQINADLVVRTGTTKGEPYSNSAGDNWEITLVDTGEDTLKGARLKRIEKYILGDTFMCTYGDGIANVDLLALVDFHMKNKKIATVTGVHPIPRFGEIHCENDLCTAFTEKQVDGSCWVNGGFFVFDRKIFEYLSAEPWCDLEIGPLELLANKGELAVFKHHGFWGCMDTVRDMAYLDQLWRENKAEWRVW
jgi:glucose-1-phosphate cytidylyltransferase